MPEIISYSDSLIIYLYLIFPVFWNSIPPRSIFFNIFSNFLLYSYLYRIEDVFHCISSSIVMQFCSNFLNRLLLCLQIRSVWILQVYVNKSINSSSRYASNNLFKVFLVFYYSFNSQASGYVNNLAYYCGVFIYLP